MTIFMSFIPFQNLITLNIIFLFYSIAEQIFIISNNKSISIILTLFKKFNLYSIY